MQAQFMSLSTDEKARVLLPLLPTLNSITNDLKATDSNTPPRQRTPNRRQTRAEISDRVANLPKTVPSQYDGGSLADSLDQDIVGEHSGPDWYQNLLREDDEVTQAFGTCSGVLDGCSGCSQCGDAQIHQNTATYAQIEDAASTPRSHTTATYWLAAHPYRTAHEQSGILSSVLREQTLDEERYSQSSRQKLEDVAQQQPSTCKGCRHGCDSCCLIEQTSSGNEPNNDRSTECHQTCQRCGYSPIFIFGDGTIECIACGVYTKSSLKSPEQADDSSWRNSLLAPETGPIWDASAFGSLAKVSAASDWGTTIAQDVGTPVDGRSPRSADETPDDAWGDELADSEVKPQGFVKQTPEPSSTVENVTKATRVGADHQWTMEQDEVLLTLRSAPGKQSWAKTAKQVGAPVDVCKERLKTLKNNKKVSKSKKKAKAKKDSKKTRHIRADDVLVRTHTYKGAFHDLPDLGVSDEVCRDNNAVEDRGDSWDLGDYDSAVMDGGSDHNGGRGNSGRATFGNPIRDVHEQGDGKRSLTNGGWGARWITGRTPEPSEGAFVLHDGSTAPATGWSNAEDASDANDKNSPTAPAPSKPVNKTYTVTYWATIESADEIVHIPIDSNNISGPEKTILNGPAKKVWKWMHEKGLGNKVSLQDSFDLAKEMQDIDQDTVHDPEEGEPDIYRSRAASSCWEASISARIASPSPSHHREHRCRDCDWVPCECRSSKDDGGWSNWGA
jgi:hypothetical protein